MRSTFCLIILKAISALSFGQCHEDMAFEPDLSNAAIKSSVSWNGPSEFRYIIEHINTSFHYFDFDMLLERSFVLSDSTWISQMPEWHNEVSRHPNRTIANSIGNDSMNSQNKKSDFCWLAQEINQGNLYLDSASIEPSGTWLYGLRDYQLFLYYKWAGHAFPQKVVAIQVGDSPRGHLVIGLWQLPALTKEQRIKELQNHQNNSWQPLPDKMPKDFNFLIAERSWGLFGGHDIAYNSSDKLWHQRVFLPGSDTVNEFKVIKLSSRQKERIYAQIKLMGKSHIKKTAESLMNGETVVDDQGFFYQGIQINYCGKTYGWSSLSSAQEIIFLRILDSLKKGS